MMILGNIIRNTTDRIKYDCIKKFNSTTEFVSRRLKILCERLGIKLDSETFSLSEFQTALLCSIKQSIDCGNGIRWIFGYILSMLYFFYVSVPCSICLYFWNIGVIVTSRRSRHVRQGLLHLRSLILIVVAFCSKVRSTTYSRLFEVAYESAAEFLHFVVKSPSPNRVESSPELSELLAYEELSYEDDPIAAGRRMKHMHHYVPVNPFRATVRLHKRSNSRSSVRSGGSSTKLGSGDSGSTLKSSKSGELFFQSLSKYPYVMLPRSLSTTTANSVTDNGTISKSKYLQVDGANDYMYGDGETLDAEEDMPDNGDDGGSVESFSAASPTSFPSTPFSRAFVMNRSAERVDSVMFAARDWLRLQAQTNSRDAHTRHAAMAAQVHRQFAVFDSKQCDEGIALSCGNHCALKVGQGLWSSVRSMISVPPDCYTYIEWSVTASCGQVPSISFGLSSTDFPLNSEVGFGMHSVGFSSAGLLTTGRASCSFTGLTFGLTDCQIAAGSTIGFLVRYRAEQVDSANGGRNIEQDDLKKQDCTKGESKSAGPCDVTLSSSQVSGEKNCSASNIQVVVNVNGIIIPFSSAAELAIGAEFKEPAESLYPTVSLHSPNTRVWCRFSEADMVQRSRGVVGAPPGSRVYCLDGTLLISD